MAVRSSFLSRQLQARVTPNRDSSALSPQRLANSENQSGNEMSQNDVTEAMKKLQEQQKRLQASSVRIEGMLKQMSSACHDKDTAAAKSKLPKEMSATVHEEYSRMKEDDDVKWDFSVKFDNSANKDVNAALIRSVKAVHKDADPAVIKRAARTYFKSLKSHEKRRLSGKAMACAAEGRKRQRRHNKAHARARALKQSTTLDEVTKKRVLPVLKAEFMSSEESLVEDTNSESESTDEDDEAQQRQRKGHKKKKLIRHTLSWRSNEMQQVVASLDRKIDRRRSARSKAMCLEIVEGGASSRTQPDNAPDWAIELFS